MPFVHELRGLVSEQELRGLAADLRPTVPDLAALVERSVPLYRQVRRAAGCQNDVIHPWSMDTIEDKQFPAEGKVFEEAPKPLPGLAGESRSADANGSWFRVLAAGGKNLVTLKPGVFATTPEPLLGANPPKPKSRPPLNADVACETQQAAGPAHEPGRAAGAEDDQHRLAGVPGPLRAGAHEGDQVARAPAQGRGPRRQAEDRRRGRDAAADRRARRARPGAGR